MRMRQISLAVLIACTSPLSSVANADNLWQGSYAVDDQCFCSGDVRSSVANRIVATPIGGQTVTQVCARVGEGPELVRDNGIFNFPVFKDSQCGHGPFQSANGPQDVNCVGTLDGTFASCQPAGPRWDLAAAYAGEASIAAAGLGDNGETITGDDNNIAGKSRRADSSSEEQVAELDANDGLQEAANSESVSGNRPSESLETFKGRSVTLGDYRYLQAREDMPAKGGELGSRIILDGLVFLRDDENLVVADLFTEKSQPEMAAAEPDNATTVQSEDALAEKKIDNSNTQSEQVAGTLNREEPASEESERQARLQLQRIEKEARALAKADFERDQKAREARLLNETATLAQQSKLAEQKRLAEQTKLAEQKGLQNKGNLQTCKRNLQRNKRNLQSKRNLQNKGNSQMPRIKKR